MAHRPLILAGNWKLNGTREFARAAAKALASDLSLPDATTVVLLPPACYLADMREALGAAPVALGGQDLSPEAEGAFTGDISGRMLADCGCRFVLVGHSERRQYHGEMTPILLRKLHRAFEAGLTPIVCVGEPLSVRNQGADRTYVAGQIQALFTDLRDDPVPPFAISYEPLWAIGTGEAAKPEDAQRMAAHVRGTLADLSDAWEVVPVLYGGSVGPATAGDLIAEPDIDGLLVGGASLDPTAFRTIIAHALAVKSVGA